MTDVIISNEIINLSTNTPENIEIYLHDNLKNCTFGEIEYLLKHKQLTDYTICQLLSYESYIINEVICKTQQLSKNICKKYLDKFNIHDLIRFGKCEDMNKENIKQQYFSMLHPLKLSYDEVLMLKLENKLLNIDLKKYQLSYKSLDLYMNSCEELSEIFRYQYVSEDLIRKYFHKCDKSAKIYISEFQTISKEFYQNSNNDFNYYTIKEYQDFDI